MRLIDGNRGGDGIEPEYSSLTKYFNWITVIIIQQDPQIL